MVKNYLKGIRGKLQGLLKFEDLPNNLTLLHILCVPLLLIIFPINHYLTDILCALLFLGAALTDFFDGFLARKYASESPLGALLDQIADKVLTAAMLVLLCGAGRIPELLAGLLIIREIAVSGLRCAAVERGVKLPVENLGKWKTAIMLVAVFILMIDKTFDAARAIGMGGMWATLVLSYLSAYHYWQSFTQQGGLLGRKDHDDESTL